MIGVIAAAITLKGKVKGAARRAMTPALAIRFVLLMTLLPADYAEVMAALIGDLAGVPWQRPYALPTATVASTWREAVGPGPLEELRDLLLAAIDAEHRDHDYRAVTVGDLDAHSIDGSLTRVPDTPANRQAFGSAGTADDSSPHPQLRVPVRAGLGQLAHRVAVPAERQFASAPLRINIAILGLLGTGVAYVLNYQIITSEGATIASTVTYLLPVVAIMLGVLVLGEDITAIVIAGMVLVLAGVAITRRREPVPEP